MEPAAEGGGVKYQYIHVYCIFYVLIVIVNFVKSLKWRKLPQNKNFHRIKTNRTKLKHKGKLTKIFILRDINSIKQLQQYFN